MRLLFSSCRIPNSLFRAIHSFSAETKKCPDPTAGSHILRLLIMLLACSLSSLLKGLIWSFSSSKVLTCQPFALLNFCMTALCSASLHIYIVITPGVKKEPSLYPLIFSKIRPNTEALMSVLFSSWISTEPSLLKS